MGDHILYSNRGLVHLKMEAYHLSVRDTRKCVELCPEFVKGWLNLGKALMEQREFDQARQAVRSGLKVDLNCQELGQVLAEIRRREKGEHLQESKINCMDAIDRQKVQQAAAEAQEQAEAESEA